MSLVSIKQVIRVYSIVIVVFVRTNISFMFIIIFMSIINIYFNYISDTSHSITDVSN